MEKGHGCERIAGESGERAAKPDYHQQSPARVQQHSLAGPDHEEPNHETAHNVDDERSSGKNRAKFFGSKPAEKKTQVCAGNSGDGNNQKVLHGAVTPTKTKK